MLLIDALYINRSGGLRLLEYLVSQLKIRGVDFHLLADYRCLHIFDNKCSVTYLKASLISRYKYYRRNKQKFSKVLCFGNLPPAVRLRIPTYTYYHNINLLTLKEKKNY